MGIVLLTSILFSTIVYSAFSTKLQISGEAILRTPSDIRVTDIKFKSQTGGGFETYNCKYSKDTTSLYATLPSKATITYDVTLTNNSSKDYDTLLIKELSKNNPNVNVSVSLKVGDLISKNSTRPFTVTLINNASSQVDVTVVYQYVFVEHINSYILGNYDTTKMYEVKIPYTGEYKIELWGAQGGDVSTTVIGGSGAYTSGIITLAENTGLYLYVGAKGENTSSIIFNNGTESLLPYGMSGGGATDVRLVGGDWNNFNSLKSRIMVAAGGGGAQSYFAQYSGGAGGALVGLDGDMIGSNGSKAKGGSQTEGGLRGGGSLNESSTSGGFGFGGQAGYATASGGSGYYGGGSGPHGSGTVGSGAGGSSFISGYSGCNAIAESSTEGNILHTGQSKHYSGKVFTSAVMIAGDKSMTSPSGLTETGHRGNGYARITFVKRVFD